jgi:2-aminoadipate transaminase
MAQLDERLVRSLSQRARRAGAAYAGPGSGASDPAAGPRPISFTVGLPDAVVLPTEELSAAIGAVLAADDVGPALQYGGAQGWLGLREWLAAHWSPLESTELTPGHYCVTNGSAGALANVCDTFLDAGDVVAVEAPSFPGSIRAIRSVTPRVESIPVDDDGLVVDAFEERLRAVTANGERMRLLYTIPNFHNPTGATLTTARRERLLELCARHDVLIVEDDAYGELWFHEAPPRTLFAISGGHGVIKIGSFSKIVAPGLRVGWAQADPEVVSALVATRSDLGVSPLLLRALHGLGASGFLDDHIARLRRLYAAKADRVLATLDETVPAGARWTRPRGGFFVWVTLDESVSAPRLVETAAAEGVTFVSGITFFAEQTAGEGPRLAWGPGDSPYIRLAFSAVPIDDVAEGIRRFGRAVAAAQTQPARV